MLKQTPRWFDSLVDLTLVRLNFWVLTVLAAYPGLVASPFKLAEWFDDHLLFAWEETDRITLLRYGQLPVWNPFWCGGKAGLAEPEDSFYSPDFILRLIFGTEHGRRLTLILFIVLGLEGAYRLCRRLDSSAVGSALAAVAFVTFDKYVSFVHDGWVHFLSFLLVPWVLLGLLNGITSLRWRVLGGMFFAWIVLAPGTYPAPYAAIAGGYFVLALIVYRLVRGEPDAVKKPLIAGVTLGAIALALALCKLLPTISYMREFPRVFTPIEVHTPVEIITAYLGRYDVILALAVISLLFADAAAALCIGGALLFFLLQMGETGPASAFHLLKRLPVLGALRYPERFAVMTFMFFAFAASRGITLLEDLVPTVVLGVYRRLVAFAKSRGQALDVAAEPPRALRAAAVGLAVIGALKVLGPQFEEIGLAQANASKGLFTEPPPRELDQPFRQHRGNRRDAHVFPPIGMGSLNCVEGIPVPESARLRGDLPQEEYPADPAVADVKRVAWSPNAIDLDVDAKSSTTVYVNQNWARGWRTNAGTIRSEEGLLAIDLPAGHTRVELRYRDYKVYFALLVSLATLGTIVFLGGRQLVRATRREVDAFDTLPMLPGDPGPPVAEPVDAETGSEAALKVPAEDEASTTLPAESPSTPASTKPDAES